MITKTVTIALVAGVLFTGCAKKTAEPQPAASPVVKKEEPKPVEQKVQSTEVAVAKVIENLQRVHFDFNTESMTDDSKAALSENARILLAHQTIMIEVEGHCDDRGTIEYNLALGQRRAEAVQKYFVRMGVPAARVRTISLGEEKPLADGENETVWAENRRAEFRVSTQQGVADIHGTVE